MTPLQKILRGHFLGKILNPNWFKLPKKDLELTCLNVSKLISLFFEGEILFLNFEPSKLKHSFSIGIHQTYLLISKFLKEPKNVDPYVEEILERDVCGNLKRLNNKMQCSIKTNYEKIGLLRMNTNYLMIADSLNKATLNTTINFATILQMFQAQVSEIIVIIISLAEIYPILISHVVDNLEIKKEEAEHDERVFCASICLSIFVYTVFIFMKPIQDLRKVDLGIRKILKLLPFQLFQENKALKFYLVQEFKKDIGNIKNILSFFFYLFIYKVFFILYLLLLRFFMKCIHSLKFFYQSFSTIPFEHIIILNKKYMYHSIEIIFQVFLRNSLYNVKIAFKDL